jgi:hypothetical protein
MHAYIVVANRCAQAAGCLSAYIEALSRRLQSHGAVHEPQELLHPLDALAHACAQWCAVGDAPSIVTELTVSACRRAVAIAQQHVSVIMLLLTHNLS